MAYPEVFAKYPATVDYPGCSVWRELLEVYPEAKVLVTLHPRRPEAGYESTIDTIYFTERIWQFKFLELITPFDKKMGNMTSKLIWQRSHKGSMTNKVAAIARYHEHVEEIKAAVPAERILIFTVDQGPDLFMEYSGFGADIQHLETYLVVFKRPLAHEPDPAWYYPIDDERRIVDGTQILAEKRILSPDLL